jgi:hypothetical protein
MNPYIANFLLLVISSQKSRVSARKLTATSTLASDGDDHRGSLGTRSLKYDELESSTQIDATVNGGCIKVGMRWTFRVCSRAKSIEIGRGDR